MTLLDINDLFLQAAGCRDEKCLMNLFEEAGEDVDAADVRAIYAHLSSRPDCALNITGESAALYEKPVCCPKCRNTSVYTLLGSAAEVLLQKETAHFGCCECGTQFLITK